MDTTAAKNKYNKTVDLFSFVCAADSVEFAIVIRDSYAIGSF